MKKIEAIDDKKEKADDKDEDEGVKPKTLEAQSESTKKDLEVDPATAAFNKNLKEEFGREKNTLERTDEGLKPKTCDLFPIKGEFGRNEDTLETDQITAALNKYLKEELGREKNTLERTDEGLKPKTSDLFLIKGALGRNEDTLDEDLELDQATAALTRHLKEKYGKDVKPKKQRFGLSNDQKQRMNELKKSIKQKNDEARKKRQENRKKEQEKRVWVRLLMIFMMTTIMIYFLLVMMMNIRKDME